MILKDLCHEPHHEKNQAEKTVTSPRNPRLQEVQRAPLRRDPQRSRVRKSCTLATRRHRAGRDARNSVCTRRLVGELRPAAAARGAGPGVKRHHRQPSAREEGPEIKSTEIEWTISLQKLCKKFISRGISTCLCTIPLFWVFTAKFGGFLYWAYLRALVCSGI